MEGIFMNAKILNFQEAKKQLEHDRLMKARYGAMMLAELSFADEVAEPPNNSNANMHQGDPE
jgi:hypothetical protein